MTQHHPSKEDLELIENQILERIRILSGAGGIPEHQVSFIYRIARQDGFNLGAKSRDDQAEHRDKNIERLIEQVKEKDAEIYKLKQDADFHGDNECYDSIKRMQNKITALEAEKESWGNEFSAVIILKEKIKSLFDVIQHGDESHKIWLEKAIEDHFGFKDENEWRPWREYGITELQYFHKIHLERSFEIASLEEKLRVARDALKLAKTEFLAIAYQGDDVDEVLDCLESVLAKLDDKGNG